MVFVALPLILASVIIWYWSIRKAQQGQFYQDTWWLFPLGIFVWGDGLILAPFWLIMGLLFLVISPLMVVRSVLVFYAFRAGFEVVYWLNHQAVNKDYQAPLFRKIKWLSAHDSAILYQLLNFCKLVLCVILLMLTY